MVIITVKAIGNDDCHDDIDVDDKNNNAQLIGIISVSTTPTDNNDNDDEIIITMTNKKNINKSERNCKSFTSAIICLEIKK